MVSWVVFFWPPTHGASLSVRKVGQFVSPSIVNQVWKYPSETPLFIVSIRVPGLDGLLGKRFDIEVLAPDDVVGKWESHGCHNVWQWRLSDEGDEWKRPGIGRIDDRDAAG
jgi:hypothetical protein